MDKFQVTLNGKTLYITSNTKIKDILPVSLPCGGHGRCGNCKVIARGKISEPSIAERNNLSPDEIKNGIRLACMTVIEGDCTIETLKKASESRILTESHIKVNIHDPMFTQYGLAIDIGTTTVAAKLFDSKGDLVATYSVMNPQCAYGADVISRIEASIKGEKQKLAKTLREELDKITSGISEKAHISPTQIDGAVFTGNTAMLHLLTETDVSPLSKAPFQAKRLFDEYTTAEELQINSLLPQTKIYLPPCISAFIGADTVCAMVARNINQTNETELLADIGTNGEMVLSHNKKLYACSTAAGPAFEGAGITMGMNGQTGAIDKVEIKNGQLFAHVIGEVSPIGICGSGLVDTISCLLELGILEESGYLEDNEVTISEPVTVSQNDIRKVQTAKSAIISGINTMMKVMKIKAEDISHLIIAGGFGNYLNAENAGKIGLLPKDLIQKIEIVGNAALSGASMILLNSDCKKEAEILAKNTEVLALDSNPIFTEEYIENMFLG